MKWIKKHILLIIIGIMLVQMIFTSILVKNHLAQINGLPTLQGFKSIMIELFVDIFKEEWSLTSFIQLLLVLGINYCMFYYVFALMIDFTKGVKDLIKFQCESLYSSDIHSLKLIIKQYSHYFLLFIVICFGMYVYHFGFKFTLNDLWFLVIWFICDVCIIFLIQKYNNVESLVIALISFYILSRKFVFQYYWLIMIIVLINIMLDKYRREK